MTSSLASPTGTLSESKAGLSYETLGALLIARSGFRDLLGHCPLSRSAATKCSLPL
jgi:hypothetical protein